MVTEQPPMDKRHEPLGIEREDGEGRVRSQNRESKTSWSREAGVGQGQCPTSSEAVDSIECDELVPQRRRQMGSVRAVLSCLIARC